MISMDMKRMYSVPNKRNEREVRNHNVLIYLCVDMNGEVKNLRRQFNIIYIMRTKVVAPIF